MKKLIVKIAAFFGYDLRRLQPIHRDKGYELYSYQNHDGSFDYEKYKRVQTEGNKRKIENVWVEEENIEFLSNYIRKNIDKPQFGLCHGTRRGTEQEWFRKYLNIDVIGTEISDTAVQFPNTIQWDFHEVKSEWTNNVDFIYSNSFDHSYDPEKCLNAWMSCLNKDGICILEYTSAHGKSTELDPFGAAITQMPYLVLSWAKGRYCVTEILVAPKKRETLKFINYLIIKRL